MTEISIPGLDPGEPPSTGMELIVHPTLGRNSAQFQQIVRYVEALKDGKKPTAAAREAGTTLGAMRQQGRAVQKYLARARADYAATAEEIREVTILKWVERAMREPLLPSGEANPDYDAREAMAALHELSQVPEVGLKGKAVALTGQRQISDETQAILDSISEAE